MNNPDTPPPPISTAQLEQVRALATDYVRECSDEPPLAVGEQGLALALAGAMPSRAPRVRRHTAGRPGVGGGVRVVPQEDHA